MTDGRTAGRERLIAVLLILAFGGLVVLASTRVFTTVTPVGARPVPVTGQGIAPALAPLGIVLLALAAALTIAGRAARIVLGVVLVLLGATIVLLVLPNGLDPIAGTRGAVSTATGVVGRSAGSATGTPWPLVTAATGLLVAVTGAAVLVRAPGWPTAAGRYRQGGATAGTPTDPVDEWDALTRGADPTGDDGRPGPPPSSTP